jgi:hypothetical protein
MQEAVLVASSLGSNELLHLPITRLRKSTYIIISHENSSYLFALFIISWTLAWLTHPRPFHRDRPLAQRYC